MFNDSVKNINGIDISPFLIGDSAFRLSRFLMKPYPFSTAASEEEKLFNYNLSKCRRVVENAFGHLKARFRRVGKGLDNSIKHAANIIKVCCVLHNFLNETNDKISQKWVESLQSYENLCNREQPDVISSYDFSTDSQEIRKNLANYMFSLNQT